MNAHQEARIAAFRVTRDAVTHAQNCLESRTGWDVETLSFNIECGYPEIESNKCERIANAVMRSRGLVA